MMFRRCFIGLLLVSLVLVAASAMASQEQAPGAQSPQNDAMALLERTADFLSQAKQFSVTIQAGYDVLQETGQKIEFSEVRKLTLVRPDRIRVDVDQSDGEKVQVVFDGQEITVFSPVEKVFASAAKPGDVDGAIFYLLNDLKLRMPLALMFVSRLPMELDRRVRSIDLVEQSTIMDVPCAHLAARTDDVDFQIWIPIEGDPLPQRVLITYVHAEGQPQFWANFTDWNLSPNPPEGFFSFTPPEGVQRIPFLAQVEMAKPEVKAEKKVKNGGNR